MMIVPLLWLALAIGYAIRARRQRGWQRWYCAAMSVLAIATAYFSGMTAYYRHQIAEIEADLERTCGDDCLRPGEEMACTLDLITGEVRCVKGTPRPGGVET